MSTENKSTKDMAIVVKITNIRGFLLIISANNNPRIIPPMDNANVVNVINKSFTHIFIKPSYTCPHPIELLHLVQDPKQ